MIAQVLLVAGLFAAAPEGTRSPADLEAYEKAKAGVGRDPEAHVRLALWCEAHGLEAERLKHLAIAVVTDPGNALARGLMGLVEYRGRWQRPEAVNEVAADDALLAQYRDRRVKAADTADSQWNLALWCERNGLKAEAAAHLSAVVRLDPGREAAWKRLGYRRRGSRWVTDEQLAAERAEADRQKQADRRWKPLLEKWRDQLGSKVQARRAEAEASLSEIADPRAVPMVWAVFAAGGPDRQAVAVRVFGQVDAAGASRALATLAIIGRSAEVRRTATETLKRRDVREFADLLIALLRDPLKFEVRPVGGPGSPGVLFVEGQRFDVQRLYSPPSLPPQVRLFADSVPFDPFSPFNLARAMEGLRIGGERALRGSAGGRALASQGMFRHNAAMINGFTDLAALRDYQIGLNILEVQEAAAAAQRQLSDDVESVEAANREARSTNARVADVLNQATGADLPEDRRTWLDWWMDRIGNSSPRYDRDPKPTVVENVTPAYQPRLALSTSHPFVFDVVSCFGAGTPVHTLSGIRPIESLHVGDQVLTQDIQSGALGYHPVLVVHRNPPSKTFRVAVGGETVVSSHFHRFWKAGRGWVMARDLKPGDMLRTLEGLARVESVERGETQPVFNLDVAEDHDFFVGGRGALVHDNTLPDLRLAPFDTPADSVVATRSGRH